MSVSAISLKLNLHKGKEMKIEVYQACELKVPPSSDGNESNFIKVMNESEVLWLSNKDKLFFTRTPEKAQRFTPSEALKTYHYLIDNGFKNLSITNGLPLAKAIEVSQPYFIKFDNGVKVLWLYNKDKFLLTRKPEDALHFSFGEAMRTYYYFAELGYKNLTVESEIPTQNFNNRLIH